MAITCLSTAREANTPMTRDDWEKCMEEYNRKTEELEQGQEKKKDTM